MPQIKVLPKLRLGVSHLYEHKFRHGFMDMLNPLCSSSIEAEATISYYCTVSSASHTYQWPVNYSYFLFMVIDDNLLISLLLYGVDKFDDTRNK